MNVWIFGGTGFIGRKLTEVLLHYGYQVFVVTRNREGIAKGLGEGVYIIEWDNSKPLSAIRPKEIDVVVNLAGESIGSRRWSNSVKREIIESRIKTTQAIVTAINSHMIQPKLLINASAVGYYGPQNDEIIIEGEEAGNDFLAKVCQAWEKEAYQVETGLTRVISIRIGLVLGNEGALKKMALPFKFFVGGPLGTGDQWLSWIHVQDLTHLIKFSIEHEELSGTMNGTAPEPVKMKDFCKVLGEVMKRPSWFPVPEFLLKTVLGQMSEMLLHGQRVMPKKAVDAGFEFRFPKLRAALEDVLKS